MRAWWAHNNQKRKGTKKVMEGANWKSMLEWMRTKSHEEEGSVFRVIVFT
jgi:hypothetical protein